MKIEFSLALVYSAQRPGSHPLRWQGSGSFAVTLCLQVSCQLGQGREPVPSESNAAGLRGAGDLQVHENLLFLGREVAARSKLPHVRRGLFWVQGSCSPEGHGGIPLLFCGSKGRVVIAEVNLDAPGGLQDTWPPRVILPPPALCTHLSGAREGRAAGDMDTGLGAPGGVGELHFQGLCVGWLPHLSHCPLLHAAFF